MSVDEIAQKYNVTANQVRYALDQDKKGLLSKARARRTTKDVEKIKQEKSPDVLLESQFHHALAQMEAKSFEPEERVMMLDKLFNMSKTLQATRLVGHLKRADAEIIGRIIRRYEPEADDQRIIQVYREELEKHRAAV